MFGRLLGWYTISRGSCYQANFDRCKIHFASKSFVLYWQRYCTALEQWVSAKLCGVQQRAPRIFGRAITLGIGPHSSYVLSLTTFFFIIDETLKMLCSYSMRFGLDSWFIFGRPFVKRFALCYQTVVCPSCQSVCVWRWCIVANGWMDQDETWHGAW